VPEMVPPSVTAAVDPPKLPNKVPPPAFNVMSRLLVRPDSN